MLPVWLLALGVFWVPVHLLWHIDFAVFAALHLLSVVLLFLRPVQVFALAPLLGASRPTPAEQQRLDAAWQPVLDRTGLPARRYVRMVLPSDDLNAFACGGHLVVVTSFALETLPTDELSGVLAHELSHHLGLHTVALTVAHWLSMPALLLARVGFFLQNVADAATSSFASNSPALTALGRAVAALLTAVSWIFVGGLALGTALSNLVGKRSEFQADRRAVEMGFGRPLAQALRRVLTTTGTEPRPTLRDRLAMSHPSARTRVARIEALMRVRRSSTR
jgi:Zn-dependent protease with chaperone function